MKKRNFSKVIPYVILSIIALLFILPLLWVFTSSLDPHAAAGIKLPDKLTVQNFIDILANPSNQRSFIIGIILSLSQAVLVVVFSALAAYPLSRYQIKYKKQFILSILFMTCLPITAVMVPVYQLFIYLNLQDSLMGTIFFLAASALPFGIWMMKNFMDSIPLELEEAAWVDGASTLKSLTKVILPLMVPGTFTVMIYTFIGSWGNFFVPYILIQSPNKFPASVTIYQFFGQHGMVEYGRLAAFSVIYMLPVVILYILSQSHMSKGFSLGGASKG
ncbi:carbohydrate ABC transporter permease [Bacillus timonensis]|uniref:carbohydrate ABC transporter permease n=1 Tax=Bacillus timonensis TaxID=1033734 RepID=UPI000288BFD7|nr:carbohydrate ABC transporter permease [Bacillus timonensis]